MTEMLTEPVAALDAAERRELEELRAMRSRACALAATLELGGAGRTYRHAGRFVLGLAGREDRP